MGETNTLIPPDDLIKSQGIGDGDFREIGEAYVARFANQRWFGADDVFLDIGCGLGRMARPLTTILSEKGQYFGFDINKASIEWCREKYMAFSNFHFEWIDLKSIYYNPQGLNEAKDFRFPLAEAFADFINLSSVFTHMLPDDVRNYMMEIGRMLKPGKRCVITYFLVDPFSRQAFKEASEDGKWHRIEGGYVQEVASPEKLVLLDEDFVRDLYPQTGLRITDLNYGHWCNHARGNISNGGYQDEIVAVKL